MPRFDTRIITAKYAGTAIDGTTVRKGDRIAYCTKSRKVLTSDPARIEEIEGEQIAAEHDMRWEDACARQCGLI